MADPTQAQVAITSGLVVPPHGPAIDQAILTAITMVNEVLAGVTMSSATKDTIKLYLACHFAELSAMKGPLETFKVGEATERYHDIYEKGLYSTRFGQQVAMIDTSGKFAELAAKANKPMLKAQFTHVGPAPYEDYEQN